MAENPTNSSSSPISSGASVSSGGSASSGGSPSVVSSGAHVVNGGTTVSGGNTSGNTSSRTTSGGNASVSSGASSSSSMPGVAPASNGYGGGVIPDTVPSSGGNNTSANTSSGSQTPNASSGGAISGNTDNTSSGGSSSPSTSSGGSSSSGVSSSNPYGASPSGVTPPPSNPPVSSGATRVAPTFGGRVTTADNRTDDNANVTPPQAGDTKLMSIAGRDNTLDKQPLPWNPKFILHTTTGTLINQAFIVRIDALPSGGSQVTLIDESTFNFHLAPKDLAKQFSGFSPVDVTSGGVKDTINTDGSYVLDMESASSASSGS